MPTRELLTPGQAEQVVADRIERFGLGSRPDVKITLAPDGNWQVSWDSHSRTVSPMDDDSWRAWLHEHVGPLDAESLQTTES